MKLKNDSPQRKIYYQNNSFLPDITGNIKKLRIQKGLTQKQLALKANVSQPCLSTSENEIQTNMGIFTLEKILKALDTNLAEFFITLDKDNRFFTHSDIEKLQDQIGRLHNEIASLKSTINDKTLLIELLKEKLQTGMD